LRGRTLLYVEPDEREAMPLNPRGLHPADESGAFDLPSVITGVVVVGVLTAGVLASVFGVIPFAQDNGAKQDLAAVRTAQGVHKATKNSFTDKDGLQAATLLNDLPEQMFITDTGSGAGFCASTVSATGRTFKITSEMGQPEESATGCPGAPTTGPDSGAAASKVNFAAAPVWSTGYGGASGEGYFGSLAASADGTRLIAGQGVGPTNIGIAGSSVYLSSDSGKSWTQATGLPSSSWESAGSSADGRILFVAQGNIDQGFGTTTTYGRIWRSEDFGATWTPITNTAYNGNGVWQGLEVSSDGQTVVALEASAYDDRGPWISHDAGRTWKHHYVNSKNLKWTDVSVSADGQTIVASSLVPDGTWGWSGSDSGTPEISTDGGATWSYMNVNGKSEGWTDIAVSGNGQTILVSDSTAFRFYRSTDAGKTWTKLMPPVPVSGVGSYVGDMALSADGSKAILGKSHGDLWISTDSGTTWMKQVMRDLEYWDSVTISPDGSFFAAASAEHGSVITGAFPSK
jgi:hypothetical protein